MRKVYLLFILLITGLAVASAQTPTIGVSFKASSGITTTGSLKDGHEAARQDSALVSTSGNGTTEFLWTHRKNSSYPYVLSVNNNRGYVYVPYDADDALGTAFANGGTWEILFRLDSKMARNINASYVLKEDGSGSTNTCKIFSSQESGGWSLQYVAQYGLQFQYLTDIGTTTVRPGYNKAGINTHDFYHVVVTVDKSGKTMKMYINGEEKGTITHNNLLGTFKFPNIGTTKREKGLWFNLGSDPGSTQETPTGYDVNNSCRTTIVFANYYSDVLTTDQIATKANATNVTKFTHPAAATNTSDLMWDVLPGADGSVADKSPYNSIGIAGALTTSYNSTFKRYEVVSSPANATKDKNFAYREFHDEPSITKRLANNMAIEVYCKANVALPSATKSPLSFQQDGGGTGIEFRNTGVVKFNYNNYGYLASSSKAGKKSLNVETSEKFLDTEYHHYIATVDNVNGKSYIYRDGIEVAKLELDGTELTDLQKQSHAFTHESYQWFCFNGDTKSNRHSECDFPFDGNIVFGRVWGKTLTADDAAALSAQARATSLKVTVGASKVTTAIFPFAAVVPAGVKAYVVNTISSGEANTVLYASPGEVIPYGTPVILYGAADTYTFNAADLSDDAVVAKIKTAPAKNLLTGSYASKVAEADQISVLRADGTGFETAAAAAEVAPLKAWLPAGDVVLRGDIPVVKFDESYDIAGLSSYTGENVDFTFTRSFTKDVASTVCLPFAFTSAKASDGITDGGKFYTFKSVDLEAMTVYMEEDNKISAGMTAGVPYLFVPDVTGEVTFTGSETVPATPTTADQVKDDWTFAGTYSRIDWDNADKFTGYDGVYGFVVNAQSTLNPGDFAKVKIGGSAYTPAFRAIMKYKAPAGSRPFSAKAAPSAPQKMKVVLIGANGTVTGVSQIDVMEQGSEWYTVDGKKLQGKPTTKGIYIRDGKKVWVSK